MKATRVRKARRQSTCPLCRAAVSIGQQIGRTPIGWCHTRCIIGAALTQAGQLAPATTPLED